MGYTRSRDKKKSSANESEEETLRCDLLKPGHDKLAKKQKILNEDWF